MFRVSRPVALLSSSLALLAATQAPAASTSFWSVDSYQSMRAGTPRGTSVLRDGAIVVSPDFERHEVEDAQYVWSAALGPDGSIYAVSGTPGRLLKLEGSSWTTLASDETSDYPALAVTSDGEVYFGTSPGGVIYRLGADGNPEMFFDTGQGYVWSMAYWPGHGLVVGTGDSAKVFLVDESGKGRVIHSSDDSSVAAAVVVGGRVLVGTSPDGVVVDVTPGRGERVLFDSTYEEISGIAADSDGRVYFAGTTVSFEQVLSPTEEFGEGFGEGSVYAATPAGGAVEVWYSEDAPITALGNGTGGKIWVGTGLNGRVHELAASGGSDIVTELDDDEVLSVVAAGDGALVTTGLSASVYYARERGRGTGEYESSVFDARAAATWGELTWTAEVPPGTSLRLATRSGNTATPDATWSDWEEVRGDGEGAVASPPGRRLQWKAELTSGRGSTPTLRGVEVAFVRENLPPHVISVTVYEPGDVKTDGGTPGSASQTLPSGVEVTYSVPPSGQQEESVPEMLRGIRTAEWSAIDPNGDPLTFSLMIRSDDETRWKTIVDDLDRSIYTWDSTSMPDGRYLLRVVASDAKGNQPGAGETGTADSAPFIVDNSPPTFEALDVSMTGTRAKVVGEVSDAWSQVIRVEVSVDYGDWTETRPDDGSFDSRNERFSAEVEVGPTGAERVVAVRALDRAGNVAVARRVLK